MLADLRKIPYLLVWKREQDGAVKAAVRMAPHNEIEGLGGLDWTDAVEVKRHDGTQPNPNGTPAGNYTLSVAATSGSVTEKVSLTLTVQ